MCKKKHALVQKCLQMVKTRVYHNEPEWKHRRSGKEKVSDTAVCKEGHADSLLGHERTHHIDITERAATVNCQLLRQYFILYIE